MLQGQDPGLGACVCLVDQLRRRPKVLERIQRIERLSSMDKAKYESIFMDIAGRFNHAVAQLEQAFWMSRPNASLLGKGKGHDITLEI